MSKSHTPSIVCRGPTFFHLGARLGNPGPHLSKRFKMRPMCSSQTEMDDTK